MTSRKKYEVTTKHPTGYMDGTHVLTVNQHPNDAKWGASAGKRFVDGSGFGCSRDYDATTDESAIRTFLSEHAMKATNIKPA